jgi:hypothetical protein
MCQGRTFLNVFTTEGWPNGTLPTGDYNIFNNFIDRFWWVALANLGATWMVSWVMSQQSPTCAVYPDL